ncbi:hypothetical protein H4F85_28850, partial [Citrobacter braakii]
LSDDFIEDAQRSPRTPAAASATGTRPAGAPLDPASAGGAGAGEPMAAAGLSGVEPAPALGVPGEGESGTLEAMELQVIRQALEAAGGNISVA